MAMRKVITMHKVFIGVLTLMPLTMLGASPASAQSATQRGISGSIDPAAQTAPYRENQMREEQLQVDKTYEEGLLALSDGDYETAELKFSTLIREHRRHPQLNYYMALAKIGNGKTDESVTYLMRAVRYDEDYVEARETLALVQASLGNMDDAKTQLSELQNMMPECQKKSSCDAERLEQAIAKVGSAVV